MHRLTPIVAALAVLLIAGCSGGANSTRNAPDYRQANTLPPLEVPPDLTSPVVGNDMAVPELGTGEALPRVRPPPGLWTRKRYTRKPPRFRTRSRRASTSSRLSA